eukprot:scaffold78294_cov21-Prasinocladus_malaysianus.AAC.1
MQLVGKRKHVELSSTNGIANVHTVRRRKLCLASGESIKLSANVKIIFETASIVNASPASIGALATLFADIENVPARHFIAVIFAFQIF